jgi:hypothetical protein
LGAGQKLKGFSDVQQSNLWRNHLKQKAHHRAGKFGILL